MGKRYLQVIVLLCIMIMLVTCAIAEEEYSAPMGAGVNVIIYKNTEGALLKTIAVENKFDMHNEEYSGFVVFTLDLSDKMKAKPGEKVPTPVSEENPE